MAKNVLIKTVFCLASFAAGIAWGIAAEAWATGMPIISVFQG